MIEGLRALPHWREAIRRNLIGDRSSCETCMDRLTTEQRQIQGCGFAPAAPAHLREFVSPAIGCGYEGPELTVCPGYSTNLPEVIEVARARVHWSKGAIQIADIGLHHPLTIGIEILEGAVGALDEWRMKPAKDGGGGS